MTFDEPVVFDEALRKLDERTIVTSPLRSAEWRDKVAAGLRDRAFFSATVENARVLQTMRDYLGDFLAKAIDPETGGLKAQGRAEFVADMRELCIREGLGKVDQETGEIDPEIDESDLTDLRSMARLQLIFDTQTESANEYGYWSQGNDPDVLAAFPALRFIRVRPVRTPRPLHEDHEGEVRRKDDLDFWLRMNPDFGVPYGPWGYGSGMGVEDVDRLEAEELGLIAPGETIQPPARELNDRLSAGIRDMDPPMVSELRRIFGDQVRVGDGKLEWTGSRSRPAPERTGSPGGIASLEAVKVWLGPRRADLSGNEIDIIAEARNWPEVDAAIANGNLPPEELADLLVAHPRHPATVAMRTWGNDEREFSEIMLGEDLKSIAWRNEIDRILAGTAPAQDVNVIYRGWSFPDTESRSAALRKTETEPGFFKQKRVGMSASKELEIASGRFLNKNGMLWEIRNPKTARDMSKVFASLETKYSHESEMIFPRGAFFRLIEERREFVATYPDIIYRVYEEL